MRKVLFISVLLILFLGIPTSARAAPIQGEQPIAHAIILGSNGCSNCSQVLADILPTVQEQSDSKLSILPNEPAASGFTFTSFKPNAQPAPQAATDTKSTGMVLAWVIMVFMLMAIILMIVSIIRAFQGKPVIIANRWLDIAIPVLAIIGLGASIYLTYVEFTHARALCGPVGDCNAVQSSPFAKLFGVVPIGLVGAIGYIAILVTWLWRHFRIDSLARIAGPLMFGMALFGTLFSIYLTYLELFVIHAVCIWCLSSALIITALMLLNLPATTQWLTISDEEE